jgi:hypothetical protein
MRQLRDWLFTQANVADELLPYRQQIYARIYEYQAGERFAQGQRLLVLKTLWQAFHDSDVGFYRSAQLSIRFLWRLLLPEYWGYALQQSYRQFRAIIRNRFDKPRELSLSYPDHNLTEMLSSF